MRECISHHYACDCRERYFKRLERMLMDCRDYFDNFADVGDSDRGVAEVPNEEMKMLTEIDETFKDKS